VDQTGKTVIQPQFDSAEAFSEGLARVIVKGQGGYINQNGTVVIEPQFERAESFAGDLAAVQVGQKWGYISSPHQS
jgi:hypothetical protein